MKKKSTPQPTANERLEVRLYPSDLEALTYFQTLINDLNAGAGIPRRASQADALRFALAWALREHQRTA